MSIVVAKFIEGSTKCFRVSMLSKNLRDPGVLD